MWRINKYLEVIIINKTVLIGRLTKDPELKFASTGTAVTTFTVAVNRRFKKEGQQDADFIPVVVWGKQAESTANYMSKGKLIGISGRIETRSYEAKDGTRKYVTEVIAEEVQFLEWGEKSSSENNFGTSNDIPDLTPSDEDIPF